jgi:hypothetical protein
LDKSKRDPKSQLKNIQKKLASGEKIKWQEGEEGEEGSVPGKNQRLEFTVPKQLELFIDYPSENPEYTNQIDLYDLIPKFVDTVNRDNNGRLKTVERQFRIKSPKGTMETYKIKIIPAQVEVKAKEKNKKGETVVVEKMQDRLPGLLEERVDEALKKLACQGCAFFSKDPKGGYRDSGVAFNLNMLKEEIERSTGVVHRRDDLLLALKTLARSRLVITPLSGEGLSLDTSYFTYAAYDESSKNAVEDLPEKSRCYVAFHKMVSLAIQENQYRLINYAIKMKLKNPVARKLFTVLTTQFRHANNTNSYHTKMNYFLEYDMGEPDRVSTVTVGKRSLERGLEELKSKNVIESYEMKNRKDGRKIVDVDVWIYPSTKFVKDMKKSNWEYNDRKRRKSNLDRGLPIDFDADK